MSSESTTSTDPLRVLHVVEASFEGVGQHVLDLAGAQVAKGWAVEVAWSPDRATERFIADLDQLPLRNHHRLSSGSSRARRLPSTLRELRSLVRGRDFDIVHGHSSKAGAWVRMLGGTALRVYTPNALITQSDRFSAVARRGFGQVEKLLARRTDLLIYVSEEERSHGRSIGLAAKLDAIVPNGIELVALQTRSEARTSLGRSSDRRIVGFVGRLDHQKGVDILIEAFDLAFGEDDSVELVLIGEGPHADQLEAQASATSAAGRIVFLGRRMGQQSMPAFDVMAVPSRYEGFPYVVIEGLWAASVMVVSDQASSRALIEHGVTGFVAPVSPAAFGAALREAMELSSGERHGVTTAAKQRASQFSVDEMSRRTEAAYRSALAN